MSWAQRAARNIIPLSIEKTNLAAALHEWRYEGGFYDREATDADCELCDHPDIRYQFEIRNQFTDAKLQIGSECINRLESAPLATMVKTWMRPARAPRLAATGAP